MIEFIPLVKKHHASQLLVVTLLCVYNKIVVVFRMPEFTGSKQTAHVTALQSGHTSLACNGSVMNPDEHYKNKHCGINMQHN